MPYSSLSEARIKKLNDVPLTLAQVNLIAKVADGIPKGQVESPWAVAIAQFKKTHKVEGNKWVKRSKEKKDVYHVEIERKEDGRFRIVTVSTAALKDKENETFTTEAIDYDIVQVKKHGDYPEYRVFHRPYLGIGRVDKMYRVGIFAVDEGTSYDDPFSLSVCEKMLADNDGKWRVSRGFKVHEASGTCPHCSNGLLISLKHMVAGFRCPKCKSVYLGYKKVLKDVRFLKARTFDVTVTDVPAVPWTSATAYLEQEHKEYAMTKEQLKQKLLEAGLDEKDIDARLKDASEEWLKELTDVPDAVLLKEFQKEEDDDVGDETVVTLDPEVFTEISNIVAKAVEKALEGLTIDVPDMEMELKELPAVDKLTEEISELKELIAQLLKKDEVRLKELLDGAPRKARLRVKRYKAQDNGDDDEEDVDEDGNPLLPGQKKKKDMEQITLGDGRVVGSLTEAVLQGGA